MKISPDFGKIWAKMKGCSFARDAEVFNGFPSSNLALQDQRCNKALKSQDKEFENDPVFTKAK